MLRSKWQTITGHMVLSPANGNHVGKGTLCRQYKKLTPTKTSSFPKKLQADVFEYFAHIPERRNIGTKICRVDFSVYISLYFICYSIIYY